MVKRRKLSEGTLDESIDPRNADGSDSFASAGEPANNNEEKDSPDVDEARYRQAFLMYLNGQTHRQIATHFKKSDRTIRRWIEKAKEKSLARIDNLDPADQLSEFLLLLDEHRAKLREIYQRAQDEGDSRLEFRCLRERMAIAEKRLRILEKMGLFDYWDQTYGNKKVVKWLTTRRDDSVYSRPNFIARQADEER